LWIDAALISQGQPLWLPFVRAGGHKARAYKTVFFV
jgi:hypothetical protein